MALAGCGSSGTVQAAERVSDTKPRPSATTSRKAPSPAPARTTPAERKAHDKRPGPHGSLRTTGSPEVALTFDDGPSPQWTPKVLALLRKFKIKATFCIVGIEAKRHPEVVQAIARELHTLCNHSWDHDMQLGSRSAAHIRKDLTRTNEAILRAVPGAEIRYYRQPGGTWTTRGVKISHDLGMMPLHWSVDTQDWRKPPARAISSFVIKHAKKGAVVLMHDGGGDRRTTYVALKTILPNLTRRFDLTSL
ncbi:MAG: polysaccharide deacetylase family protein [Micromonosporaceae bacterium]